MWFTGFDQGLTVSHNILNGGGIDNDATYGQAPDLADPKSGIKVVDEDASQAYGTGCLDQVITDNTINGFVYGITMSSLDYTPNLTACTAAGPNHFSITGNTITNSRVYGIYISGSTDSTISGNNVSGTSERHHVLHGIHANPQLRHRRLRLLRCRGQRNDEHVDEQHRYRFRVPVFNNDHNDHHLHLNNDHINNDHNDKHHHHNRPNNDHY